MDKNEALSLLESLVEEAQVAILSTVDTDGRPAMRWMTPAVVKGRPGSLFAVTSPHFRKVKHIESHPDVEWMIQTRDLNRIVNVRGRISPVDNPSLKSEVLEGIGKRLDIFWRVNRKVEFLVLETVITEVSLFRPLEQKREFVKIR